MIHARPCKKLIRLEADQEGYVYSCCQFSSYHSKDAINKLLIKGNYHPKIKHSKDQIYAVSFKKYLPVNKKNLNIFLMDWVVLTPSGRILVVDNLDFPMLFEMRKN